MKRAPRKCLGPNISFPNKLVRLSKMLEKNPAAYEVALVTALPKASPQPQMLRR